MTTNTSNEHQPKRKFTMTELTNEFSVTPRTLRFYEERGLLMPDRQGGSRCYSRRDRARLKLVLLGKRADLTLIEIKEILDLYDLNDGGGVQRRVALVKISEQVQFLQQQVDEKLLAIEELHELCELLEHTGGHGSE